MGREKDAETFLMEAGIGREEKDRVGRDLAIYLLWETGRYRNHEIGAVFGITYSAVSQRVRVMKERIGKDKEFGKRYWHLKSQFKM